MSDVGQRADGSPHHLLLLPAPEAVEFVGARGMGQPLKTPTRARQGERLGPKFAALYQAFEAQRAELQTSLIGAEPEQVLVLEVAASVADLYRAVERAGMEFLLEFDDNDAEPDDDFARTDRPAAVVPQTVYLILANEQALNQLVSLWQRYLVGDDPPRGLTKFRDVFTQLRDIRPWGPRDRVAHTGVLDEWRLLRSVASGPVPVEIELWHRADAREQHSAEEAVTALVAAAGGSVLARVLHDEIAYHALLAELPPAVVDEVLTEGADVIAIARAGQVLFLRPVGQVAAPITDTDDVQEFAGTSPAGAAGEPTIALLDGLPLAQHALLAGRLVVDDPDDWSPSYAADHRRHGTAMASLLLHGDLAANEDPLARPIYVRPILRPDDRGLGRIEIIPPNVLPVDLMLRSFRRIFEGDGGEPAAAPSVRIVNLSVGDPAAPFDRLPSSWARAVDYLSWRYRALVMVSAGNHDRRLEFDMSFSDLQALASGDRRALALRALAEEAMMLRLLSPAEALNAITVGARQSDESGASTPAGQVDLIETDELPSAISAIGRGIRRGVKPEILVPGGRQVHGLVSSGPDNCVVQPSRYATAPGQLVAAPLKPGSLTGTIHQRGTSNATALASRLAGQLHDQIVDLRGEPGGGQLDDDHLAVVLKALLVHGADWQEGMHVLQAALPDWATRRAASRLLGYGHVRSERVRGCPDHRATLIGTGTLADRAAEERIFPLPPGLSGIAGRRRLTYTLAWLSPINPRDKRYRRARLWCGARPDPLRVSRKQVDDRATRRGTVQHEVLEGTDAVPIVDGDQARLTVSCRADAGALAETVPYALVVSLEVAPELGVQVYSEVQARVQPLVQVAPQP